MIEEELEKDIVILRREEATSFKKFMQPRKVMRIAYAAPDVSPQYLEIPIEDYTKDAERKLVLEAVAAYRKKLYGVNTTATPKPEKK